MKPALEKVEVVYRRVRAGNGAQLQLRDAHGILTDGTRFQFPLVGAEVAFDYASNSHLAKLVLHGFRVESIIEEDAALEKPEVLCERCGSTTRTRCGRLGCV